MIPLKDGERLTARQWEDLAAEVWGVQWQSGDRESLTRDMICALAGYSRRAPMGGAGELAETARRVFVGFMERRGTQEGGVIERGRTPAPPFAPNADRDPFGLERHPATLPPGSGGPTIDKDYGGSLAWRQEQRRMMKGAGAPTVIEGGWFVRWPGERWHRAGEDGRHTLCGLGFSLLDPASCEKAAITKGPAEEFCQECERKFEEMPPPNLARERAGGPWHILGWLGGPSCGHVLVGEIDRCVETTGEVCLACAAKEQGVCPVCLCAPCMPTCPRRGNP